MSAVIRRLGPGRVSWKCTVLIDKGGRKREPCGHQDVSDTEIGARVAYDKHKTQEHRWA